ncbi:hypothetical protein OSB04_003544 [Centaurea solstitialis]|uniref:No apical meristem-associated C-terminal domain-containing protein n=1 Tax=Centaurea solstitialis TaxID=347529 RepID=A0AA38UCP0_9ASTR|nr:hypothetical protein OSB04_003544 [Centaurea solstitialis]
MQPVPSEESTPDSPDEGKNQESIPIENPNEITLVKAWINESENFVTGNAQRSVQLWKSIERSFYERQNAKRIKRCPTSTNDMFPLPTTRTSCFPHEDSWELLRHCRKWAPIPLMSSTSSHSTKCTRTSESSVAHFGDGDDDEDAVHFLQPQRPIGRNKAKKALKTIRGDASVEASHMYDSWNKQCNDKMEYKLKKLEHEKPLTTIEQQKLQVQLDEIFERDLMFYTTPHDHLQESCLVPLGILYLPTCVVFGYRYPFVEGRSSFSWEYDMGYFSAVAPGTRTLARGIFSTPSYPEKAGSPYVLEPITIFQQ